MHSTHAHTEYLEIIRNIISDFNADVTVEEDSDLTNDIGLSSLDQMNLVVDLEDQTGTLIPDDILWNIHTVHDLINYLLYPLYKCKKAFTLRELLYRKVAEAPDAAILCTTGEQGLVHRTNRDLWDMVCALGETLASYDLIGQKVAIIGSNSENWMLAFLALGCGAGIAVPLQNRMDKAELQKLIDHSEATALLYDEGMAETVGQIKVAKKIELDTVPSMITEGEKLLSEGAHRFMDAAPAHEDTLALLYTSGTSGDKKGVLLSQKAVLLNSYNASRLLEIVGDTANFLPLHHIFGLFSATLTPWFQGREVFLSQDPGFMFRELKAYSPVVAIMVPIMLESLKKRMQGRSIDEGLQILGGNLRCIICGGAAMNKELLDFFGSYGITLIEGYGMTETCPIIAVSRNEWVKAGSCGQILPNLSVRIDKKDDAGVGEVLVRADQIMTGYLKDEAANSASIQGIWFHTGDLGYLDADNFLFLTGRCKNLLVLSNGENISPEELENALTALSPYIEECIVFAEHDKLCVRVFANADALRDGGVSDAHACISEEVAEFNRTMPSFKQIKQIELVDARLPRTASGKIKRVT